MDNPPACETAREKFCVNRACIWNGVLTPGGKDWSNLHYVIENPQTGDNWDPDPSRGWITDEAGFKVLLDDSRVW